MRSECPAVDRGHSLPVLHHLGAGKVTYGDPGKSAGPAVDQFHPLKRSQYGCWVAREQEEDLAQTLSSSLMTCSLPSPNIVYRHCEQACISATHVLQAPKHRLCDFNQFAHLFLFVLALLWLLVGLAQN